jgi:hypothetical protein
LMEEANSFPYGVTTDILMALWFIKWNYKKFVPKDAFSGQMNWMRGGTWAGFERTG